MRGRTLHSQKLCARSGCDRLATRHLPEGIGTLPLCGGCFDAADGLPPHLDHCPRLYTVDGDCTCPAGTEYRWEQLP